MMSGERYWSADQLMRYAVVVMGAALVAVSVVFPWYEALAVNGSAVMAGWGGWSETGIDAHLLAFPVAVLIWLPAVWMTVSAVRRRYGWAALAASVVMALGILAYVLRDRFAWHRDGGGAVYIEVLSGPRWVFSLGLVATFLGWFLFSRTVLRARPTS